MDYLQAVQKTAVVAAKMELEVEILAAKTVACKKAKTRPRVETRQKTEVCSKTETRQKTEACSKTETKQKTEVYRQISTKHWMELPN